MQRPSRSWPRPWRARGSRSGAVGRRGLSADWRWPSSSWTPVFSVRSADPATQARDECRSGVDAGVDGPTGGDARRRPRRSAAWPSHPSTPRRPRPPPRPPGRRPRRRSAAASRARAPRRGARSAGRGRAPRRGPRSPRRAAARGSPSSSRISSSPERGAVGLLGVHDAGRGPADVAPQHDQRRLVLHGHRPPQGRLEGLGVVGHLADVIDVPAVGGEPLGHVVGVGELGGPVDGDVVVVVDVDEPPEPEMAGQRGRLVADPLLEVAVAADDEGVVVDELGAEARPQPRARRRPCPRRCPRPGRAGRW